jgi:hypothetical protein
MGVEGMIVVGDEKGGGAATGKGSTGCLELSKRNKKKSNKIQINQIK